MNNFKIAVLRGGPSVEHEVSLKTGANVVFGLSKTNSVFDIVINKDGLWYHNGFPVRPEKILKNTDVVFNALHGHYGEDGKLQRLLDMWNIPYTGSESFPSALCMNKVLSKRTYLDNAIKTPLYVIIKKEEDVFKRALHIFRNFPIPCVVKPVASGSSIGVYIVRTLDELVKAIENVRDFYDDVLIEEFIKGREATCGVVEDFRGKDFYSLVPVEVIKPKEKEIFDYNAKYGGQSKKNCPSYFTTKEKDELQSFSIKAHKALGLRHYSRSDFIISPKRGVYLLETNSLPSLEEESTFLRSLETVGAGFSDFLSHLVFLARNNK